MSRSWWLALPAAAGLLLVGLVVYTASGRLLYPFDLEWMEGGMLAHAWRLSHGLPLYVEPNPDFVPYVYPPGYAALVAALGSVFGLSPALGRVVSVLGTVAACAAIAVIVRREGAPWPLVGLLPLFYLGTWPEAAAFLDLVRPDALAVGLLAWSVVLALDGRRGSVVASGLLLAASYLCKHNVAAFGFPMVLGLWARDGLRGAVAFTLASAAPAGLLTALWQWRSGGLFLTYLVDLPSSHERFWVHAYLYTPRELGTALPILGVVGLWLVWRAGEEQRRVPAPWAVGLPVVAGMFLGWRGTYVPPRPPSTSLLVPSGILFWSLGAVALALPIRWVATRLRVSWREGFGLGVGGTALGVAALMRAHGGGAENVHMPLFWVGALGAGVLLTRAWRVRPLQPVVALLVCAQLLYAGGRLYPQSRRLRPRAEHYARGEQFIEAARAVEGRVLSPYAAWIPVYAGKDPSLHWMGVWDLTHEGAPMREQALDLGRYAREHYWELVLEGDPPSVPGIREHYRVEGPAKDPTLHPRSGYDVGPRRLRVPQR
jgi:hypothetical protein